MVGAAYQATLAAHRFLRKLLRGYDELRSG